MTEENKLYLYPQSSCPCMYCKSSLWKEEIDRDTKNGARSNMGLKGCMYPGSLSNCYSSLEMLKPRVEPCEEKEGFTALNKEVYNNKLATGFGKVPCNQSGCPEITYISWDPRLYSTTRNNYLRLDRPPIDGDVKLKNVYSTPALNDYNFKVVPYEGRNDGQIAYYTDKSIENPFFTPVFTTPSLETSVLFQDPMGAIKPEYYRQSLTSKNESASCDSNYMYNLSFIQDSQEYREDLMSIQMRKRNSQRWEPRWRDYPNSI